MSDSDRYGDPRPDPDPDPRPDPDAGGEREASRDERRTERNERREERAQRRAERHERRHGASWSATFGDEMRDSIRSTLRDTIRSGIEHGMRKRKWYFGFGDLGAGVQGDTAEASEIVEHRFSVSGMPRVHVNNISGETEITVGPSSEVFVRARKRVRGWSEERARRLLENVEIRLEQEGDDIIIEPRLFQQERGWTELFRGGRVAVDLDIRVPRETHLDASTVSGELSISGTRGQTEIRSVSGEVSVSDVQGPMRLRTVSGDANVTGYAGQLEANSVSGDVEIERSRVRTPDVVTVSGDLEIDAVLLGTGGAEGRLKTVSGDVEIALGEVDVEIDFKTVSGDAEVEGPARIEKEGRRDRRIVLGSGAAHLRVKTVSGDLTVRMSGEAPAEAEEPSAAGAMPKGAPERPAAPERGAAAREILERLARGELSVEDAAAALDEARR
jgi:hypothetical protein